MKKLFILSLALMAAMASWAHSFEVGGIYYNYLTDSTVTVTYRGIYNNSYANEYTGSVVVPASVSYEGKTYAVTAVANSAFYDCNQLTSITLPESITSIGEYAFQNCSKLSSIAIPEGVKNIGVRAFSGCSALKSVVWNAIWCGDFNSTNYGPFNDICSQITSFTFGEKVERIPDYLCYYMNNLKSITFPESLQSIGSSAFYYCSSLTNITIPENVTTIEDYAFYSAYITSIVWNAKNCSSLSSGSYHPFYYSRSKITSFIIGEKVETLPSRLCYGMYNLKSITIPESVTSIGSSAFYNCDALTTITIPENVTFVGGSAFSECNSLTTFVWNAKNCADFSFYDSAPFYDIRSQIVSVTFGENVEHIPAYLCYGIGNVQSLTLPASVKSMGNYAFYGCSSVPSITIPEGVTHMGTHVFSGCSSISSVVWNAKHCADFTAYDLAPFYDIRSLITSFSFGNNVEHVPAYLCYYMTNAGSMSIPNTITSVGSEAFAGITFDHQADEDGLVYVGSVLWAYEGSTPEKTSIQVKEGTTSIYSNVFKNCTELVSITLPSTITNIGASAFEGCSSLAEITIPEAVTSIADNTFSGCSSLTEITIPDKVISIGEYAFYNCSSLTSITIPNNIASIGTNAFYGCSGLTSVVWNAENCADFSHSSYAPFSSKITSFTFGDSVEHIPAYLCCDMNNLTELTIPNSVTSIGDHAFYYCSGLTSVTIGEGVTSLENDAFSGCYSLTSVVWNAKNCADFSTYYSYDCSCYVYGAFYSIRSQINSFTFGDKVEHVPAYLCYDMDNLKSITLPTSIKTVGSDAFYSCYGLTSIEVPASLTSINFDAFESCSNIASITLKANSVEELCKSNANQNLANAYTIGSKPRILSINGEVVTELLVPATVDSIYDYAFRCCSSLTSVEIGDEVTYIGPSAFADCSSLQSVTIGKGVSTIAPWTFSDCSLLAELTIPNNVASIGDYAFGYIPYSYIYFESETPATIGSNVVTGDNQWFAVPNADVYKAAWPNYTSHIVDTKDVEVEVTVTAQSDKSALHQALSLDKLGKILKLKINGTINSYDIMMLRNQMPFLRELDLSDASIVANSYEYTDGYYSKNDTLTAEAFTGTGTKIRKLILPKSLKYIQSNTINSYVKDLHIMGGEMVSSAFVGSSIQSLTLSDNVKSVASNAFGNCTSLINLDMGNGVQTIGTSAFASCSNLKQVVMSNAVATINSSAFKSCTALADITLSDSLRTIGVDAFYGCSALQAISLPDSLETIGNYAFQGAGLTSVTIPANVSSLGVGAFAGGSYSSSYSSDYGYYSSETSTGKSTYYASVGHTSSSSYSTGYYLYNGSLREVTIPADSKLKTIPSRAFEGNGSLSKLSILGDSITTIADVAFRQCQLDTLILPPNLKSISTLSFGYCLGLKYVAMPNSLTEVPANAFVGCTSLNDVQFPTKLTHIGHHAFADCTGLSNVDIPGLVTSIGDYAFKGCNVNQVHSYLFDPFTIGQNTFSAYANANAILYIPNVEDTEMKYLYDTQWSQFLNRVRMDDSFTYDDFYANGDIVITPDDDPLNGDPNANLNPGSGLVVGDGDTQQNMGTITLNGEIGDWASILAGCNLNVDTLILNFTIAGKKWHFFGFPFELKISDIISDGKFVVYEYDGQIRAERDTTGWKKISDKQTLLYPGVGYIFQFNFEVEGTFSIKVSAPQFCQLVELIELAIHPSSKPNNVNWNYIANPLLAYYDILDLGFDGPITLWDVLSGTYRSIRPGDDEYYLSPYEAFFLQNLGDNPLEVIFNREKGMTKKQMNEKKNQQHAPARRTDAESTRAFVNLTLSNGELADDTRVVFNEQQTLGYDMGWDAAKFFSTERVPQLYSYDAENTYAINERPIDNGTVKLGVQLPSAGTYSIGVSRMDTALYLWDKQEDYYHDLSTGDYYFTGKSGDNSDRFELVTRQQASTAVENIGNQDVFTLTKDGIILHEDAELQVYNTAGQTLVEGTQTGNIALPAGVYMLVINGQTYKHIIR